MFNFLRFSMAQLRQETEKADADVKKKEIEIKNPGHGYGGKFGVEKDRMDKSAVGHDYIGKGNWIFLLLTAFFFELSVAKENHITHDAEL